MADCPAPSPEPTQQDRIERALERTEQKLDLLLMALAEDVSDDEDAPRPTLDGDGPYPDRDPLEPM